jgi:hypothetical protein
MATRTTRKASPVDVTPESVMTDAGATPDYVGAPTPESAARALGMPNGKAFRRVLRDVFGLYVSRGGTWDARTRAFVFAWRNASGDARTRIVASFKAGDALPPTGDAPADASA